MKKRISLFVVFMFCVMIAGCGGKATSQQKPTDQPRPTQETVDQNQPKPAQETEALETQDQPDDSNQDVDVAKSDVKHWKIKKGTLLGQTGPEEFVEFASLPADSGIRDYAKVVSSEANDKLLIKQDAAFYRFDLTSNQATLINPGAYDSSYDSYAETVYFVKPDGAEYAVDWKTGNMKETNNFRENYNVIPNSYKIAGFDEFAEIQDAIKNGNYKAAFDKGYIVEENGDIYDFKNHYITNVHLPEAYAGNIYTATAGDVATLIKDGKASFYRYGEELATIDLPEGGFVVADLSNVNVTSALLYNLDDRSFYKAENGSVKKIFSDVKDYFAPKDGQIFWIDGENRGNVCNWNFDQNYATVAEDITGVSHYRDFPGFVVDEDKGEEHYGLQILVY